MSYSAELSEATYQAGYRIGSVLLRVRLITVLPVNRGLAHDVCKVSATAIFQ
jgi:hypothetical protein